MTELIRNPNRHSGKAHRRNPDVNGSTLCGQGTRDMTETIPYSQSDPGDLCQKCERKATR